MPYRDGARRHDVIEDVEWRSGVYPTLPLEVEPDPFPPSSTCAECGYVQRIPAHRGCARCTVAAGLRRFTYRVELIAMESNKEPEWKTKLVKACAEAAHEMNRVYCESIGDFSQPAWKDAPDWQKESAIGGVYGVLDQRNGPRESHETWLKEKTKAGWMWGPEKNPALKTHPCMVPYDDLPEAQKLKDRLFVTTVQQMAAVLAPTDYGDDFLDEPSK